MYEYVHGEIYRTYRGIYVYCAQIGHGNRRALAATIFVIHLKMCWWCINIIWGVHLPRMLRNLWWMFSVVYKKVLLCRCCCEYRAMAYGHSAAEITWWAWRDPGHNMQWGWKLLHLARCVRPTMMNVRYCSTHLFIEWLILHILFADRV